MIQAIALSDVILVVLVVGLDVTLVDKVNFVGFVILIPIGEGSNNQPYTNVRIWSQQNPERPCGDLSHCCDSCCDDWCTTPGTTTTTTRGDGTTTTTTTTTRTTKPTTKPTAKPTLPPGLPEECYDYGDGIIDPDYEASPGELVFVENWDTFNMDIWEHEITMGGGGNWEFQLRVPEWFFH